MRLSQPCFILILLISTAYEYVNGFEGESLLSSFKDLYNMIKNIASEVLPNLNVPAFMKTLGDTISAAIDEECIFRCPNGKKPRLNIYYEPKPNGCGVPGLQIPKYIPIQKLEDCCNVHDICYATCNKNKEKCDKKFKECLYSICSFFGKIVSDDINRGCKGVAKTLYTAVTAMGCKYYLNAQKDACICTVNYYTDEL